MRFGLSLPHYGFSLPGGEPVTFEALADCARRAEDLGFDSVWVSDHFFYSFARYGAGPERYGALEPLTALAGSAAVTSDVRLGVLVLGAAFRHPALVAKMAANVDLLSGGRLELGFGAGWLQEEFDAFGYTFGSVGDRFAALEDSLAIVSAMLGSKGDRVTYEGKVWSTREAQLLPGPAQSGGPPLWAGGKGGPRLLRLAARYASGWNVVWRFSDEWYRAKLDDIAVACEAEGRDPATFRKTVGLYSLIGRDQDAARDVFERGRAAMPGDAMAGDSYETWCAETLSGTSDMALERVAALEAMGVEEIVIAPWVLPFAIPEPALLEATAQLVVAAYR